MTLQVNSETPDRLRSDMHGGTDVGTHGVVAGERRVDDREGSRHRPHTELGDMTQGVQEYEQAETELRIAKGMF